MPPIAPLIPELQKVAVEELGEVPSRIPKDLLELKQWLEKQGHLLPCNDEQYLIQYLRSSKYNLQKSKKKLDFWLTFPKMYLIKDVEETKFRQFLSRGSIMPLPIPLNGFGPRIILIRVNFSIQDFTLVDFIRYFSVVHFTMLANDPYACIIGCVYIFDYAGFTTDHLLQLNRKFIQNIVIPVLRNTICRIKGICALNVPTFGERLLNLALFFMPKKIRKRNIICNKNMKDLYELVPQKYLPLEYGGENGSLEQLIEQQAKTVDEHREYISRIYEYGRSE